MPDKVNQKPADTSRGDVRAGLVEADIRIEGVYTTPMQHHNPHRAARDDRAMGRRPADAARLDAIRVGRARNDRQGARHRRRASARRVAVRRRRVRLQGIDVVACRAGGDVRARNAAARQAGARRAGRCSGRSAVGRAPSSGSCSARDAMARSRRAPRRRVAHVGDSRISPSRRRCRRGCSTRAPTWRRRTGSPSSMSARRRSSARRAKRRGPSRWRSRSTSSPMRWMSIPLALRLRNHADRDPQDNRPWSSKHLRECYAQAAERFGWSRRTRAPGSMRDRGTWVGYGHGDGDVSRQPLAGAGERTPAARRHVRRRVGLAGTRHRAPTR